MSDTKMMWVQRPNLLCDAGPCGLCHAQAGQECVDPLGRSMGSGIHAYGRRFDRRAMVASSSDEAPSVERLRLASQDELVSALMPILDRQQGEPVPWVERRARADNLIKSLAEAGFRIVHAEEV